MMNSMANFYTKTVFEKDDLVKKRKNTNYAGLRSYKEPSENSGAFAMGSLLSAACTLAMLTL